MKRAKEFFRLVGFPGGDAHDLPTSATRFPDGAHYRVEIPSVEGAATLGAVLAESDRLGVTVHRVSQGSGMMLLTEAEMREIARIGRERQIEVCLFVGPRAPWEGSAQSLTPDGNLFGWRHMGMDQLAYAFEDVLRGVGCGIRSILVSDEGLIYLIGKAREQDVLPIDLYIEAPDRLGGFTRYYELPEIIRVAAPIYLKFGLRNAPGIYPSGQHLEQMSIAQGRERVRRAAIGLEILERHGGDAYVTSRPGAAGLGIPEV